MGRPRLIILDLNGTLLSRICTHKQRLECMTSNVCPDFPDLALGSKVGHIYLRPYLDEFTEFLFDKFHVATWTSSSRRTSREIVSNVFGPLSKKLVFSFDALDMGNTPHPIKDLKLLWDKHNQYRSLSSQSSEEEFGNELVNSKNGNGETIIGSMAWTAEDTIIIDDDPRTALRNMQNYVPIPRYSVTEDSRDPCEDTALLSHIQYFSELDSNDPRDVREWIQNHKLFDYDIQTGNVLLKPVPKYCVQPKILPENLRRKFTPRANKIKDYSAFNSKFSPWGSENESNWGTSTKFSFSGPNATPTLYSRPTELSTVKPLNGKTSQTQPRRKFPRKL